MRPRKREHTTGFNYIPYILAFSCATYCNLIGAGKADVHDSPDPSSLFACKGAGLGTRLDIVGYRITNYSTINTSLDTDTASKYISNKPIIQHNISKPEV